MNRCTRSRAIVVLAAVCLALQGCASAGLPDTQTVRVETPGCAQVTCELRNDQGHWRLPRTPGSVTLTTSSAPLIVSCRADEGVVGGLATPSALQPTTGAGAVAGGALGGAGIGVAFGATALAFIPVLGVIVVLTGVALGAGAGAVVESGQRAAHYPDLITIPMSCAEGGAVPLRSPLSGAALGLSVRGLPPAQALEAGWGERSGVLVTAVVEGSAAAAAGLRSGDIILSINGQALGEPGDMEARMIVLAPGAPLALRVWRAGQAQELLLVPRVAVP